jgi:hypothetical protein
MNQRNEVDEKKIKGFFIRWIYGKQKIKIYTKKFLNI